MKGYLTSYVGLFEAQPGGAPTVGSVEIPLIQRDYAQGRSDAQIELLMKFNPINKTIVNRVQVISSVLFPGE